MGPGDPYASQPAPPRQTPSARPVNGPADGAPESAPDPVRVRARLPEPSRPSLSRGRFALGGAAVGLVVGALVVTLGVGAAVVVVLCTALGAALGALLMSAFADGVDVGAAWRALRRRG